MRTEDFDAFRDLLSEVYAFYRQSVSQFVLDIWWQALKPHDLEAVRRAFGHHCTNPDNGQFPPKPADVVRMLGGTTKDSALVAWARVERAVRDVGSWNTVVFDDPIIHRAIEDIGGWVWLCEQTEDEWPFVEKRFVDYYRAYKTRGGADEYKPKLVGRVDLANIANGYPEMEPVLVGDPLLCARVLEGPKQQLTEVLRERISQR